MSENRASADAPAVARARALASLFRLSEPIQACDFPYKGNINQDTYLISAGPPGETSQYLLQRINHEVFTKPRSVMRAMLACLAAQQESMRRGVLRDGEEWEPVRLIPTRDGRPFLETEDEYGYGCWRLMSKVPEARAYKSLSEIADPAERLDVAEQAGSGLALYGALTADMDLSGLERPLPGYRDTHLYYSQLLSVLGGARTAEDAEPHLPADPVVRESALHHFLVSLPECQRQSRLSEPAVESSLRLLREERPFATRLVDRLQQGIIRTVAIHGDTKLDNFLFSARTGKVKALIDLDTIMPHTWLSDWGDLVRSLVNVAGEKAPNPTQVQVDLTVYEAVARGFLRSARGLPAEEIRLMVDAPQIIALELGARFLADYLRGDTYFKLGPRDPSALNRTRAIVQLTLFQRLREAAPAAQACIERLASAVHPPSKSDKSDRSV